MEKKKFIYLILILLIFLLLGIGLIRIKNFLSSSRDSGGIETPQIHSQIEEIQKNEGFSPEDEEPEIEYEQPYDENAVLLH